MAVTANDVKIYLSGGAANANGHLALGGAKSSNEVGLALHDLWDLVSSTEASVGDTEYRCLYIQNTHGTQTAQNVDVFISANTPSGDTTMAVGLGTSAVDGTEQTVADEDTAPTSVTFSAPSTRGTGLSIGNLTPGQSKAIWLRRTITASAAAYDNDQFTLDIAFDTAA